MSLIALMAAGLVVVLAPAPAARAQDYTQNYTGAGCYSYTVPRGVTSMTVTAIGSAGETFQASTGGLGDRVDATLTGLTAGVTRFRVCVDVGGGAGPTKGGGASGISLGADFSRPIVVAGGGGGGGPGIGVGGSAGAPIAGDGTKGCFDQDCAGKGGNNTTGTGGAAGSSSTTVFGAGAGFTAAGPGVGGTGATFPQGYGGGGGAGLYGGGGGAYGGGGGGTDYCGTDFLPAGSAVRVSDCRITSGAGTTTAASMSATSARVVFGYGLLRTEFSGAAQSITDGTTSCTSRLDPGLTRIPIQVSGLTTNLTDLTVSLGLKHGFVGDLDVLLYSPGGLRSLILFSDLGDGTCGSGADLDGTFTFDDLASSTLAPADPGPGSTEVLTGGTYRPQGIPNTSAQQNSLAQWFGSLTPAQLNGTWEVLIRDWGGGGTGQVTSARLSFLNAPVAPPVLTVTGGPATDGARVNAQPTYTFSSDPVGTYECRVGDAAFAACASPYTAPAGADGSYVLQIRATANGQASTVQRTWVLDRVAPTLSLNGPADGALVRSAPTYLLGSAADDLARTECRVDGTAADFATCTSPFVVPSGIGQGAHTVYARAVDTAGNVGAVVSRGFTLDNVAPTLTFDADNPAPGAALNAPPTYRFTVEPGATTTCAIDDRTAVSCSSPYLVPGPLAEGSRSVTITARDEAGNTTVLTRTFTYDTTGPRFTVGGTADAARVRTAPTYTFTSTAADVVGYRCRVDAAAFAACSSPFTPAGPLSEAAHTVVVEARDNAGNTTTQVLGFTYDLTAPAVAITEGPLDGAAVKAAPTYAFASTATDVARFECRLDDAAWAACTSAVTVPGAGLSEAVHTFAVRAVDEAGNTGESVSRSFTFDVTAPELTITGPAQGARLNVLPTYGLSTPEPSYFFTCRVDQFQADTCGPDFTPPAFQVAEGQHTITFTVTDAARNTTTLTRSFVYDVTAPGASIGSGPAEGARVSVAPSFGFASGAGDVARFECAVGEGAFATCTSPFAVPSAGLVEGSVRFRVRALDEAGNTGAAAERTVVFDVTGPAVSITAGPVPGARVAATAGFDFASADPDVAGFECRVDSAAFAACAPPFALSAAVAGGLSDGGHTVEVRAVDTAGNVGTPASRAFVLDTTPPVLTVTAGPADGARSRGPVYEFDTDADVVEVVCKVGTARDAGEPCSSPWTVPTAGLGQGSVTVSLLARDEAGNPSPTVTRTFVFDTVAASVVIDAGPAEGARVATLPSYGFSSPEADAAGFECRVDQGVWSSCTSSLAVSGDLEPGGHTVGVRVLDEAGNVSEPVSRSFVFEPVIPVAPASVDGVGRVGETVSLTYDLPDVKGVSASWSWRLVRPGDVVTPLPEAGTTVVLRPEFLGGEVQAVVTFSAPGWADRTVVASMAAVERPVRRGVLAQERAGIGGLREGRVVSGRALRVVPGAVAASGGVIPSTLRTSFQWLADGVAIPGATRVVFRPRPEQLGARIAVQVTRSAPGYVRSVSPSVATVPVRLGRLLLAPGSVERGTGLLLVSKAPPRAAGYRAFLGSVSLEEGRVSAAESGARWTRTPVVAATTSCGRVPVRVEWLDLRGRVIHRDRTSVIVRGCDT